MILTRRLENIAKRRNPFVQLYLYPAKVQGDGAAQTIVAGIQKLDTMGMDTIIIGRGGGSIEDLWPFNEEIVARAIFAAKTPIISGTGHEIDNTIADYVADLRAPTPSAACELAIPDVMSSLQQVKQYEYRLQQYIMHRMQNNIQRLQMLSARLDSLSPKNRLENQSMYLDSLQDKLMLAMRTAFNNNQHRFQLLLTRLDGLSPTAKLVGGYGYIEGKNGNTVKSIQEIREGDTFAVTVWDGRIEGVVTRIEKMENGYGEEE